MQLADGVPNGVVSDCALKEEVGWLRFLSNLTGSRDTSVAKMKRRGVKRWKGTYEFFGLFDACIDLWNIPLGLIVDFFNLIFPKDL